MTTLNLTPEEIRLVQEHQDTFREMAKLYVKGTKQILSPAEYHDLGNYIDALGDAFILLGRS